MPFTILSTLLLREVRSWFLSRRFTCHLVQSLLKVSLFSVAIRTEHLAFFNLLHDALPPVATCYEMRNRDDFIVRVDVVEVKTPSIVLATVTAFTARQCLLVGTIALL